MENLIFKNNRKSFVDIGEIYFWTATINNWQRLLSEDKYKQVIIESLKYLNLKSKIEVFAFVIMPNHIHFIWRMIEMNGKEMPHVSFLKYTAHKFKELLKSDNIISLERFKVDAENKNYEFWQRDSLAVKILSKEMALQKLEYLHNNPLAEHWNLVIDPSEYKYSSAAFYEKSEMHFNFLKDLLEFV